MEATRDATFQCADDSEAHLEDLGVGDAEVAALVDIGGVGGRGSSQGSRSKSLSLGRGRRLWLLPKSHGFS